MNINKFKGLAYFDNMILRGGLINKRNEFYEFHANSKIHYVGPPFDLKIDEENDIVIYSGLSYYTEVETGQGPEKVECTIHDFKHNLEPEVKLYGKKARKDISKVQTDFINPNRRSNLLSIRAGLKAMLSTLNSDPQLSRYSIFSSTLQSLIKVLSIQSQKMQNNSLIELSLGIATNVNFNTKSSILGEVLDGLIKLGLVDKNTNFINFRRFWFQRPIAEIQPIRWIGYEEQLNFFIVSMKPYFTPKKNFWPKVAKCFVNEKEEPYVVKNLSQSSEPIENVQNGQRIKEIADKLKPLLQRR